jgi:hypothetical protein
MLAGRQHAQTDTRQPGRVIELCGLPGAGKSTLARKLVQELADRGHTAYAGASAIAPTSPAPRRVAVKAALAMAETLAHPACTAASVTAVFRSGQSHTADVPARALQWTVTQRLLRAARRTPGLHVFDEGVIQALWSLGLCGDARPVLRALDGSRAWARPDLVVVLEAPLDVVLERLVSRPSRHSRIQALDPILWRPALARGQWLLDQLVSWWSGVYGQDGVARVRGPEDVADLVTRVGEFLARPETRALPPGRSA